MNRVFLFTAILLAGVLSSRAELLKPSRVSEFKATKATHNIFWPIGWSPTAPTQAKAVAAPVVVPTIDPSQFNISTILLGSERLAVINGREVSEGSMIQAPSGVATRVVQIRDGAVVLQAANQDPIVVPLKTK